MNDIEMARQRRCLRLRHRPWYLIFERTSVMAGEGRVVTRKYLCSVCRISIETRNGSVVGAVGRAQVVGSVAP